jgi:Tfp pilus assembly PilM family ATPase
MKNVQLARLISLKLRLIQSGVGIYIGDTGVYAAELSRTVSGVVLSRCGYEPFASETEEAGSAARTTLVSDAIRKCCQKAGIKPTFTFSSLSPKNVVTRYFQTPIISRKDWKEAIHYEGFRFVPFRLDETVFDFYAKENGSKNLTEVVFNVIRIDTLKEHARMVEGANFKLWDTEPPFHSMARALKDQIKKQKGAVLLLHFSADGNVLLCIVKEDIFYVARDFFLPPESPTYLQKFFSELNSSLDYFKGQTETAELSRVILAGDWNLTGWKENLSSYFPEEVKVDIAAFPVGKNVDPARASAFLIPIGLALRSLGIGTSSRDISLLTKGPVAEERLAPRKWSSVVILAVLLIGVLFYFGFFVPRFHYLKGMLETAGLKSNQLSAEFPDFASQSVPMLEKRLSSIETKTKIVATFQASRSFIGEKLSVLSQVTPAPIWFSSLAYEETMSSGGKLSVEKRQLVLSGCIYFREIPEEELKRLNEFTNSLQKNKAFMAGFNSLKCEGVERSAHAGRNLTKFRIVCAT